MRRPEEQTASEMAALLHDQPFCVSLDIIRNVKTFFRRVSNEGFAFLTKCLPQLGKRIDCALSGNVAFCLPLGFKAFKKTRIPHFLGSALRRIFDEDGFLLETPCYLTVAWIRSFCYYSYKIEVPFKSEQIQDFTERFLATDAEIGDFAAVSQSNVSLRNLMRRQLSVLTPTLSSPSFGPGISSNCERDSKYAQYVPPGPFRDAFGRDFFHLNVEHVANDLCVFLLWFICSYFAAFFGIGLYERGLSTVFDSIDIAPSKVLFVPKDSRGPRTICCEDSRLMYAQKSLQKSLYSQVEASDEFGGFVNFTDQSINQRLTFDKRYATIDLKDASDRVSNDLVVDVFPQNLMQLMSSCRSTRGTVGDEPYTFNMKKFAPMGSALCFPVMALIAYTAVTSAIYLAGGDLPRRQKNVFVYGDDIIVPNEWAEVAMSSLESIGLLVNREKSFINSRFTESCGQDTLDQTSVNCLRKKRLLEKPMLTRHRGRAALKDENGSYPHHVSLYNRSGSLGFKNLQATIEKHIVSLYGKIPYGTVDSPYPCKEVEAHLVSAYNYAEKIELNGKLRAWVVRGTSDRINYGSGVSSDYARVRRFLLEYSPADISGEHLSEIARSYQQASISNADWRTIGARTTYLQKRTHVKWGLSYAGYQSA